MRHAASLKATQRRAALRRGLARHRPRPPLWSRAPQAAGEVPLRELALALLGVAGLAGCAFAAAALIGQGLTP